MPELWRMPRGECGLLLVLLACCAALWTFTASMAEIYPDFFDTWSFAKFSTVHPSATIYDHAALRAYQRALAPGFASFFPFPYPPSYLLLLVPLAWLPFAGAALLWTGFRRDVFARRHRRLTGRHVPGDALCLHL